MTKKENLLHALTGKPVEYVPSFFDSVTTFDPGPAQEFPPFGSPGGPDGYGVLWTATDSAAGAFTPSPMDAHVLTDITKWKEQVTFPHASEEAWEKGAEIELAILHHSPDKLLNCMSPNGLFERLHMLMGFEEALVAIYEEPEAVCELLDAITEYKISVVKHAAKYYHPDVFTYLDDYAFENGLLMSPDVFRELFKPRIQKIIDAVHKENILFKMHCCGKMESLLGDFLEMGIDSLDPCQPCNDVKQMIDKAHGKIGFMGGLDIKIIDKPDATEAEIREETRRCIQTYGPTGYIVGCASLYQYDFREFAPGGRFWTINDECAAAGR